MNDTIRCPPSQSGSLQPSVTHELPTRRITGRLGAGGEAGGAGVCVREYTAVYSTEITCVVPLYKAAECHMCSPGNTLQVQIHYSAKFSKFSQIVIFVAAHARHTQYAMSMAYIYLTHAVVCSSCQQSNPYFEGISMEMVDLVAA